MRSGVIDSLKIALSDRYNLSDSDYMTLSDILVKRDLSNRAFENNIISLIILVIGKDIELPISLSYLKKVFSEMFTEFRFVDILGELMKDGFISIKKVSQKSFDKDTISKSGEEESDRYLVVYGTDKFDEVCSEFRSVLDGTSITEARFTGIPKRISDFIYKLNSLLRRLRMKVELESYSSDDVLGVSSLNIVVSGTSKYLSDDSFLTSNLKKNIKIRDVKNVECYEDSDSELYIGFEYNSDFKKLASVADGIYTFLEDMEVNHSEM